MIVGITAGVFDLLHAGHTLMFEYAKRNCDKLIVAVQVDPSLYREGKQRPIETIYERWVRLTSSKFVDEVIPYETEEDLENILRSTEYQVRFIGADHFGKSFTGDDIKPETFHFNPRDHLFSSTDLKERVKQGRKDVKRSKPKKKEDSNHEYLKILSNDILEAGVERYEQFLKKKEQEDRKLEKSYSRKGK